MQLEKIEELVAAGREEGAEIYQPPCRLPEKGYWFAPTVFTNVAQSYRIAQEEIFGPGAVACSPSARPTRRSRRRTTRRTASRPGVWTEKGSRILWMAERLRAGVVWANTYNRFDPDEPVRRLQGVGLRPRGRPARARAVPRLRRLRSARHGADDGPALARIDRATWTSLTSPAPAPPDGHAVLRRRTRARDVLVAVVDGAVAGYVHHRPRDRARRRATTSCTINGLAVDDARPAARRRTRADRRRDRRGPAARRAAADPARARPERGGAAPLRGRGLRRRGRRCAASSFSTASTSTTC